MDFHKFSSKVKRSKAASCILVLWGEHFDEVAATIFTVTLRQAGLRVKVVGVNGLLAIGRNGLALHADTTLSEVMTWINDVFCLILPGSRAAIKRMENDPRIHELFAGAIENKVKFVVQDHNVIKNSALHLLTIPMSDVMTYAKVENLGIFAKEVANLLLQLEQDVHHRAAHTLVEPATVNPT